ncbi:MAG: tRNA 4-thiouridine(8) synthase ThiI [Oscillospiraceae bacterium]|jgi:thiamine biosynthesis protein ThiI|nr:tRNA 4-thiouridine(8) synthase ThiI [Oscillospiraceae bacterium]
MNEIILAKLGEVVLKGLNRKNFENVLIKTIKTRLKNFGEFEIKNLQSTIYIIPRRVEIDLDATMNVVGKIFGIAAFCKALCAEKDIDDICAKAVEYSNRIAKNASSFKVETKRSDKKFMLKSPQISDKVGEFILKKCSNLHVDVHNPDFILNIEIRDFGAYIHGQALPGAGGIPVGTGGKAAVLISGGIDSPVASWLMAKRGLSLVGIHFASPPYTSPRAEDKVTRLLQKVSNYSGKIPLFVVPFTKAQEEIQKKCKEEFRTIIMRRLMMKIAEKLALYHDAKALVTGESLGQVASQTLHAISCIDIAVSIPVFRPLIGMDKNEIVCLARKIDTFNISIEPYEDCCTIFTPRHPRTRPMLKYVLEEEDKINWDNLTNDAYSQTLFNYS